MIHKAGVSHGGERNRGKRKKGRGVPNQNHARSAWIAWNALHSGRYLQLRNPRVLYPSPRGVRMLISAPEAVGGDGNREWIALS